LRAFLSAVASGKPVAPWVERYTRQATAGGAPGSAKWSTQLRAVVISRVVPGPTRADFAAAVAAVLTLDDQAGKVYELGGSPFTLAEYAAELSAQRGQAVVYQDMPTDDYRAVLVGAGLPAAVAGRSRPGRPRARSSPRR